MFVAEGADATLVEAVRTAGIPLVPDPDSASVVTLASVTGQLGDAPGAALLREDAPGVGAALAHAARARAPMIVLTSHEPTESARAIKTTVIAGADSAAHWAAHAAQAAMAEPPGPVWLVVAPEVASRSALPLATVARPPVIAHDAAALDVVARHLAAAVRPLIVAGRECRAPATAGWLRALAEALPAPVLVTPAARGALPDPHPLCFGPLTADAAILARADLVLALGVDADELVTAGVTLRTPVLRLGRTAAWDAPGIAVVADAHGDVALLLEELAPRLRDRARADWDVAEVDRLRRARPSPAVDRSLHALVTELRDATPAGTIAIFPRELESASALWLAVNPGELLVADAVLPAAVGAALQRPDVLVLALTTAATSAAGLGSLAEAAGVRVATASASSALARVVADALEASGPRVIVIDTAG